MFALVDCVHQQTIIRAAPPLTGSLLKFKATVASQTRWPVSFWCEGKNCIRQPLRSEYLFIFFLSHHNGWFRAQWHHHLVGINKWIISLGLNLGFPALLITYVATNLVISESAVHNYIHNLPKRRDCNLHQINGTIFPTAQHHGASLSMLAVLQDLLGHLLHHRVEHQKEWSGDTVQHISNKQLKEDPRTGKKITNMFNESAHSTLCDSATTEDLDSIPSSVLTTSRRVALEESNLSSKLTRLLTIRL